MSATPSPYICVKIIHLLKYLEKNQNKLTYKFLYRGLEIVRQEQFSFFHGS